MTAIAFVVAAAAMLVFGGAPAAVQSFGLATLALAILCAAIARAGRGWQPRTRTRAPQAATSTSTARDMGEVRSC